MQLFLIQKSNVRLNSFPPGDALCPFYAPINSFSSVTPINFFSSVATTANQFSLQPDISLSQFLKRISFQGLNWD